MFDWHVTSRFLEWGRFREDSFMFMLLLLLLLLLLLFDVNVVGLPS